MKRLISLLAILLLGLQVLAAPVSESTAKSLAEKFLQRPSAAKLTNKGMAPSTSIGKNRVPLKTSAIAEPAYYVFNFDGGGFVIIAGEDSVEPVLGYSRTGHLDMEKAPANLKWWMDGLASDIALVRSGEAKPVPAARKAWSSPRKYGDIIKLHQTALWAQEAPFNNECPKVGLDGSTTVNAVTGCVATAGAIVAYFFKWPDAGVGTTEAYTFTSDDTGKKVTIPAVTLGRSYDWDNMLSNYNGSYNSTQAAAVAALMADIGRASMMSYNYDNGSGTFDQNLLLAFQKHFKYNKKAYQAPRDAYSDAEWIALLKQNLDRAPIAYGGISGNDGGHEFVLDGYTADNYFDVNWGWGSSSINGFFTLNSLTLSSYNFKDLQSALLDLYPDRDGSTTWSDNIMIMPYSDRYPGLYTTTKTFEQNKSFTMRVSNYYNNATMPFNGNLYIAVYDKKDNWKENISEAHPVSNMENAYVSYIRGDYDEEAFVNDYWLNISCKITQPIKGGDRIRLRYEGQYSSGYARSDDADGIWEIILKEDTGADAEEIASSLILNWHKAEKKLTLSTSLDDISFVMKDAAGATVHSKEMVKNQMHEFNCATLAHGTYSLEFTDGETYSLSFTL